MAAVIRIVISCLAVLLGTSGCYFQADALDAHDNPLTFVTVAPKPSGLFASGTSADFGVLSVGQGESVIFKLQNNSSLHINDWHWESASTSDAISYTGGGPFPGRSGTCGGPIDPGQTCTVDLTFEPSASTHERASFNFVIHGQEYDPNPYYQVTIDGTGD